MTVTLRVAGMDGVPARQKWDRAGGQHLVLKALQLSGINDGDYQLRLVEQVKARGTTPRFQARVAEDGVGVLVRTRPGGSDSCLEGWLSRTGGQGSYDALFHSLSNQLPEPSEPVVPVAPLKSNQLPEPSKPVVPVAPNDDFDFDRMAGVVNLAKRLKSLREAKIKLTEELRKVDEETKAVLDAIDASPLYDAISVIESLKGGGK